MPRSLLAAPVALLLVLTACAGSGHDRDPGAAEEGPPVSERIDQEADEAQRELEEATD